MLKRPYHTLNQITVSASALTHNFQHFQSLQPHASIAPVLKANAYGHGLTLMGRLLDRQLTVPFICVDSLFEAYELYKAKIKTPILIIGYTDPENFNVWRRLPFSFPVFDITTLHYLNRYQPGCKVHLKFDTGMNRLGFQPHQVEEVIHVLKIHPKINVEGIYSHLSQSDNPHKKAFTDHQLKTFKSIISQFKSHNVTFKWRHLQATSGAITLKDQALNLIRTGLGFYGYSPFPAESNTAKMLNLSLRPALTLTTRIAQIKTVEKGSEVSYNGTYVTKKPSVLAQLPIGYADGLNRRLSNRGVVRVGETYCPIVGRICMNMTIIDITKTNDALVGDQVEIISPNRKNKNTIGESSRLCDMIPYEFLVNLNPTIKRVMVE